MASYPVRATFQFDLSELLADEALVAVTVEQHRAVERLLQAVERLVDAAERTDTDAEWIETLAAYVEVLGDLQRRNSLKKGVLRIVGVLVVGVLGGPLGHLGEALTADAAKAAREILDSLG